MQHAAGRPARWALAAVPTPWLRSGSIAAADPPGHGPTPLILFPNGDVPATVAVSAIAALLPPGIPAPLLIGPGALFLTAIALLPIWLSTLINVPFTFGGTSLLIVVGVALDTLQQMQQHLLLRKYDGFMKKGRVRFRGRQGAPGGF